MSPTTVFDALLDAIHKAALYHKDDVVPPAAILWTDEKREFERVLPRLRLAAPHVLTLGPYDLATRTGPAIWLRSSPGGQAARCLVAVRFDSDSLPARRQSTHLARHRRMPARTPSARRVAISGSLLVATERERLDRHRVPPVREGRVESPPRS